MQDDFLKKVNAHNIAPFNHLFIMVLLPSGHLFMLLVTIIVVNSSDIRYAYLATIKEHVDTINEIYSKSNETKSA